MFGATHGYADQPCVLGVPKLVWTEAAKVKGGMPWHAGVLQGAERLMTSWHKDEEEASRQQAIKRGGNGPKNSPWTLRRPTGREDSGWKRRRKNASEKRPTAWRVMLQI